MELVVIADIPTVGLCRRHDIQESLLDLAGISLLIRVQLQQLAVDVDPEDASARFPIMPCGDIVRFRRTGTIRFTDRNGAPYMFVIAPKDVPAAAGCVDIFFRTCRSKFIDKSLQSQEIVAVGPLSWVVTDAERLPVYEFIQAWFRNKVTVGEGVH